MLSKAKSRYLSGEKIFSISLLIILLLSIGNLFGETVSIEQAENVAKNWYLERCKEDSIPQFDIIETFTESRSSKVVYYIFNFTPSGYVIVSADDISTPVLGYSYSHSYETINHPPAFDDLLEWYALQIDSVRADSIIAPFEETTELWNRLNVNPEDFVPESISREVEPLLTTEWGQGQYYNEMCPYDTRAFPYTGNNYVLAGCAATAMAQVMKYWNYPTIGTGSHGYYDPINYDTTGNSIPNTDYGWQFADFGATTYNWANMPNSVTSLNTDVQTLLYHCGVSVEMNYGPYSSVAYPTDLVPALTTYFNYDQDAQLLLKSDYTDPIWEDMIRDELDNGIPLIYIGYGTGGHSFNLDGYEGTNHFHFNWGWSGWYNGYYYLSNLNPGDHNYTQRQRGVFGIEPSLFGYVALDGGTGLLSQVKVTFRNFDTGEYECTLWADLNGYFHIPWSQFSPGCYDITFSHASNEYENVLICGMCIFHPGIITPNPVILKYNPDKYLIVPYDYPTIKEAINCIQDDGTVVVLNGTYTGEDNTNLTWHDKHITVRAQSSNQPENCIIEGSYGYEEERAFILNDPNINNSDKIIGFTIRNFSLGPYDSKNGAGIFVYNGASPTIENCIIENCFMDNEYGADHIGFGVGIYCEGTTVIKNCIIQENEGWDIQGGAGIACKGNVLIDGCTIRNNLIGMYVGVGGGPDVDYAGVGIFAYSSDNGSPTIINNTIYDNHHECDGPGAAIYVYEDVETDIPVKILNNTIYNNPPEGIYSDAEAICIADGGKPIEICGNLIYNNNTTAVGSHYHWSLGPPVGPYYFTFENNTIMNNQGDGLYIYDGEETLIKNNIIAFNSGYGVHWDTGTEGMTVEYSIIYDNDSGDYDLDPYEGPNTFHINPQVDIENRYQPIWSTDTFSPCIDTGDPDTEWDTDNTPPDMGAIPAISHDYFYNQYDGGVIDQIEWISFPALNRITDNYTEALGLLNRQELLNFNTTQSDDILDHVVYEGLNKIYFADGSWHNNLGNFDSKQGYKIVLQEGYTSADIGISGMWEDESEPIQLYANKANWVGCYLEEPASLEDAFESIWDEWISITSEHWAIIRPWEEEEIRGRWTVNPGELYIIRVQNDCELIWNESSPPVPPYRKEMTDYFSYEEKLDYMPILVDTVYGDTTVAEIGVYYEDECIGASKVTDGYPVQILAYTPESGSKDGGNGLQFMLYYGSSKNKAKVVTNYTVFNRETSAFVNKPVYYDRDDFVRVRLNTEGYQPEYEFALMNNYPNPVNTGMTNISFAPVKDAINTEIQIFNIKGQLVRKLDCNEVACKNGRYTISWDCRNENGIKVSSGIYFYKLISDNKTAIKKMLVIR